MNCFSFLKDLGSVCSNRSIIIDGKKYFIRYRLALGGFSTIDLIKESGSQNLNVLKRIVCHSEKDEKEAMKEIDYMKMFRHPNLISCEGHAINRSSSNVRENFKSELLIVLPYFKNGSLAEDLERLRRMSQSMNESRVKLLLIGICEGLLYLHEFQPTSIAHRDIKPHNVMLHGTTDNGKEIPVLIDFGSMGPAQCEIKNRTEANYLTDFAAEKCTMPYRAPELFQVELNRTIDEKVDIWSLGCTLYAMLYGESPFDSVQQRGDSIALAVLAGSIKIPPSSPTITTAAHHSYSSFLLDLMFCMLKVDPVERSSVRELLEKMDIYKGCTINKIPVVNEEDLFDEVL